MKHGTCDKCQGATSYSDRYDVYYCDACEIYLENKCIDKECEFCTKRPDNTNEMRK